MSATVTSGRPMTVTDGFGDRRPGGPQGVVVDAEPQALGLQVLGPPGPVVHPVVGLAHDVAVGGNPLGVVDPTVGADHGVPIVPEGRRHPVDVGLPHVLGYQGVVEELVAVGAPVERTSSTNAEPWGGSGCSSRNLPRVRPASAPFRLPPPWPQSCAPAIPASTVPPPPFSTSRRVGTRSQPSVSNPQEDLSQAADSPHPSADSASIA